jgi:hypothetical protein
MYKGTLFLVFAGAILCTVLFLLLLPWIGTLSRIERALILLPPFGLAVGLLIYLLLRRTRNPSGV